MKTATLFCRCCCTWLLLFIWSFFPTPGIAVEDSTPEVGIAVRDISPELPIRLAGYAGRKRPADKLDHPLLVQALALKNLSGERFVFVALDNCEVSGAFIQPVLHELADKLQLARGTVAVVSSHTHSAPVLEQTLTDMAEPQPEERERIENRRGSGSGSGGLPAGRAGARDGTRRLCHEPPRLSGRQSGVRR
jgi:hypothetical protein